MRIGLLWRREWDPFEPGTPVANAKLHGMFAAFAGLGVDAVPVVYADGDVARVREELLALDGVLVWVNPIEAGRSRSQLDQLLRDVAAAGVFVSAHPDVILKLGTKQVLWDTRELSWSSDVRIYRTAGELRAGLAARLGAGPRVLKQHRGMGGAGVWKVEAAERDDVLVQEAAGDGALERLALTAFIARCERYFARGPMLEQPYCETLRDGMIRAYLSHDRVVGFTHQYPRGLMPPGPDDRPAGKVWERPDTPRYASLRARLEGEWVPELQRVLELDRESLPVIWDADFLFGVTPDTYVLCEINASSTFAFPEFAMPAVAQATLARVSVELARRVR